ncbi:MAG: hypothetical protein ACYCZV_11510 [Acidimicrobiales bacterium]
MSDLDDYADEMRKPRALDDRAVEAFFAGRNLPADEDLLGSFAQSVRAFSLQPAPTPRGELAAVLMDGLTIEKGDLPVTAASNVTGPQREVSGLPKWRRPRMTVSGLLSALITKLGTLGLVAKAGLAIALTAAGVTAAGAAGALPAPVQNVVAHAVSDVTPFSFPTTANSHAANFAGKIVTPLAHTSHHGGIGATVSKAAKSQGSAERAHPVTGNASTTGNANSSTGGPPANPGSQSSTGLNQAKTTPAAGHVPTKVPAPANPGSQSSSHPTGAPTNSGSTNSGSTNSGSTNPGSTNSGSTNSGSTNSGSTNPGSTNSAGHRP